MESIKYGIHTEEKSSAKSQLRVNTPPLQQQTKLPRNAHHLQGSTPHLKMRITPRQHSSPQCSHLDDTPYRLPQNKTLRWVDVTRKRVADNQGAGGVFPERPTV